MKIPSVTWQGESIDDIDILRELPRGLTDLLGEINGFILHGGAIHVRGASLSPEWHSLRAAWRGESAFHTLYDRVEKTDIPFAQDQYGDQILIRDDVILRLLAETGEIETLGGSLEDFFNWLTEDIEGFLNVGLNHTMEPGQLLLAYPPFVCKESGPNTSLKPVSANEVVRFHADLARQIRDVPNGGKIEFEITDG